MYISASKSIDRDSTVPPMRLRITKQPAESENVGDTILAKETTAIKPIMTELIESTVGANSAIFNCSVTEPGTIYFAVMEIGTNRNKVVQDQIYNESVATGVSYGRIKTAVVNEAVDIKAQFTATGLLAQTTYLVGAYVNTSVGISETVFQVFRTDKSSNGAAIKIAFTQIEDEDDIIEKLSQVLRISADRIFILTMEVIQVTHEGSFVTNIMNERQYEYEIAVGPDSEDDQVSPKELLDEFIDSKSQRDDLEEFLPSFIETYTMSTREIIPTVPEFRDGKQPAIDVVKVDYESVKIQVNMWEQAYVYGVIVEAPSNNLLSAQIIGGYNQDNQAVDSQHFSGKVITNSSGSGEMTFTLLNSNTTYLIFVSAESPTPFQPRLTVPDSAVEKK